MRRIVLSLLFVLVLGAAGAQEPELLFSVEGLVSTESFIGSPALAIEELAAAKERKGAGFERQIEARLRLQRGMQVYAFPEYSPDQPGFLPVGTLKSFTFERNEATGDWQVFFRPNSSPARLASNTVLYLLSDRPRKDLADLPLDAPSKDKECRTCFMEYGFAD